MGDTPRTRTLDLRHLINLAEDVFDKEDLAVVFTALKPTCRLFYEDIKAIQERLAGKFVDDICKVPSVVKARLAERAYDYSDDYDGWLEEAYDSECELYWSVDAVCRATFGPEYNKAETALIHVDARVDSLLSHTVFKWNNLRADDANSAYRCFAAAQALVARNESEP